MKPRLDIPAAELEAFCRKWQIAELSVFGSALRNDFSESSDVDVLVKFTATAPWSYWDWPAITDALASLFGFERIDLVEDQAIVNPIRRRRILSTRKVLYAA